MDAPSPADRVRRFAVYFLAVGVLAAVILVVAGFATGMFWLASLGLALVVLATVAFVAARPQGINWARRFGMSLLVLGLLYFVFGFLDTGADDGTFRLLLGATSILLAGILLAVDAVRRSKQKHAVTQQGAS